VGPIHGFLLIVTLNRRISTAFSPKTPRPEPFALPSRDARMCVRRATAALSFPEASPTSQQRKQPVSRRTITTRMNPDRELRAIILKNK
jgi:hypothetical protein